MSKYDFSPEYVNFNKKALIKQESKEKRESISQVE